MPGGIHQRQVPQRPFDELVIIHLRVGEHRIAAVIRPAAAGVRQQMLDGDLFDVAARRRAAVVVNQDAIATEDAIAQVQPPPLDQREDRYRGDRLAHAGDAEQMRGRHRFAGVRISDAESLHVGQVALRHGAVPRDRDREPRHAVVIHVPLCDAGHGLAFGRRDLAGRLRQDRADAAAAERDGANRCGNPVDKIPAAAAAHRGVATLLSPRTRSRKANTSGLQIGTPPRTAKPAWPCWCVVPKAG